MSAEGKKKRGIAGVSNAKSIPFRYGGKPCNYGTGVDGYPASQCGNGSKLVGAMLLGSFLPGFDPSDRLLSLTDHAMQRCKSELHRWDD